MLRLPLIQYTLSSFIIIKIKIYNLTQILLTSEAKQIISEAIIIDLFTRFLLSIEERKKIEVSK